MLKACGIAIGTLLAACAAWAQPANDVCQNAQAVAVPSSNSSSVLGSTLEAGPPQTCGVTVSAAPGVWFTLVGNGRTLIVNTCGGGTGFDTKLHVYCSTLATPCASVPSLACVGGNDDFGCGPGFTTRSSVSFCSTAGQTYYVLVTAFSATTNVGTGAFNLNVIDTGLTCSNSGSCDPTLAGACCNSTTQACTVTASASACTGAFQGPGTACTYVSPCAGVGACCSTSGTCTFTSPGSCTGTSVHLGAGTTCLPASPCAAVLGACCNNTSQACTTTTAAGCAATSTFQGAGTVCGQNLCPSTGACCSPSGVCTVVLQASCTGSAVWQGTGSTCLPNNPCLATVGACCGATGTCSLTLPGNCTGTSAHLGVGTVCLPINACPSLLGACCNNTSQSCTSTTAGGCSAGTSTFLGAGTACGVNLCTGTGACCSSAGACTVALAANCTGTSAFQGAGSTCLPSNPCLALLRACCSSTNTCTLSTPAGCTGSTQTFLAAEASCQPGNPCIASSGACCNNTTGSCTTTSPNGCNASTSTYLGSGTVCGVNLCPNVGACCSSTGTCTLTASGGCTGGTQTFLGAGVLCTPSNPCTSLLRACCSALGVCSLRTAAGCGVGTPNETFLSNELTCAPTNPCTDLLRVCCLLEGVCSLRTSNGCPAAAGVFRPAELTCTADPCAPFFGACCDATGLCTLTASAGCPVFAGLTYLGDATTCTPTVCVPLLRACCDASGACLLVTPSGCEANGWLSRPDLTACTPADLCTSLLRACCDFNGNCTLAISEAYCRSVVGGAYLADRTACEPSNVCSTLLAACCLYTGTCTLGPPSQCIGLDRRYLFDQSACSPNPCLVSLGACCRDDGTCTAVTADGCSLIIAGLFQGVGSTCGPTNPCTALLGACCQAGGCFRVLQFACQSSGLTFLGAGTTCSPNPCGGSCCVGTNCSTTVSAASCAGAFTAGGACAPNPCFGACCTNGACTLTVPPDRGGCPDGIFLGVGAVCASGACVGACCGGAAACTLTAPSGCTGTFKGLRSSCSPTPCPGAGAPANDECAGAIAISSASLPASAEGDNAAASTDPMPAVCVGSYLDVWYTFTPMFTRGYTVRTCAGVTGLLDTVLSVHSACPTPTANNLVIGSNCDDDGCSGTTGPSIILNVAMEAGTTYWIRVARFTTGSTGAGGPFTLTIDDLIGACCNPDTGACTTRPQASCTGAWTVGVLCSPTTCVGRCCASAGSCTLVSSTSGCPAGTVYGGVGSTCDGDPCAPTPGACCDGSGMCTLVLGSECAGGSLFAGIGTTCGPNTCVRGSCVIASPPCDGCTVTIAALCAAGVFTPGGGCGPANDPCAGRTALTLDIPMAGTLCGATLEPGEPAPSCQGSHSRSVWYAFTPSHTAAYTVSTCGTDFDCVLSLFSGPCGSLVPVACDDDTCDGVSPAGSANAAVIEGVVLDAGTSYTLRVSRFGAGTTGHGFMLGVSNNAPLGSCCAPDGSCTSTDLARCAGVFTAGRTCDPNTCTPPTGACCCGSTCLITLPDACTGSNRAFAGSGTTCTPYSTSAPCCRGDFNHSGSPPSVQDIFDFLAAYFADDPCADSNDGGALSVQDIFDFLAAYFGGCP